MVKRGRQPRLDLHTPFFLLGSSVLQALADNEFSPPMQVRLTGLAAAERSSSARESKVKKKTEQHRGGSVPHSRARRETQTLINRTGAAAIRTPPPLLPQHPEHHSQHRALCASASISATAAATRDERGSPTTTRRIAALVASA